MNVHIINFVIVFSIYEHVIDESIHACIVYSIGHNRKPLIFIKQWHVFGLYKVNYALRKQLSMREVCV